MNYEQVSSIAINGSVVLVGTVGGGSGYGIYRSTNLGQNWSQTSLTTGYVHSIIIDGAVIFAGTSNGVYYSTDMGQTGYNLP